MPKTNTMSHKHTFWGFDYMTTVDSVGFKFSFGAWVPSLQNGVVGTLHHLEYLVTYYLELRTSMTPCYIFQLLPTKMKQVVSTSWNIVDITWQKFIL